MKNKFAFIFIVSFALFFANCGQQPKPFRITDTVDPDTYVDTYADETGAATTIDTIYQMRVNGKAYELICFYNYPPEEGDVTTTVAIVNEKTDTVYKNTFAFNSVGRIFNPAPGHYWLNLTNSGGGSGYSGTCYNILLTPEVRMQPIANVNELSWMESNRSANEILFFQAIWQMDNDENFESHFSEHLQDISVYKIMPDTILMEVIGQTVNKYDLHEHKFEANGNDSIILSMKEKEPALAGKIKWEEYDFGK